MTNQEKAVYFIEHGGYVSIIGSIGLVEATAITKFAEWLDKDKAIQAKAYNKAFIKAIKKEIDMSTIMATYSKKRKVNSYHKIGKKK